MFNSNIPEDRELPSTIKLLKSSLIAAFCAVVLLVTVVLPAEYGVDPTGIGSMIGLKKMGEIKASLAAEVEADAAGHLAEEAVAATEEGHAHGADTHVHEAEEVAVVEAVGAAIEEGHAHGADTHVHETDATSGMTHEMQVTLAPNEGTEIKVTMNKGSKVQYVWWTDGGDANFDVHADSKVLNIEYHNYEKGSKQRSEGTIEAAFDGNHGWFWRNRTDKAMTITLETNGEYTAIKELN
tara:strand:- start:45431 stop:46147 length:717 start_codon:yes stop_codon:yes gene_type:complete